MRALSMSSMRSAAVSLMERHLDVTQQIVESFSLPSFCILSDPFPFCGHAFPVQRSARVS
jgi:hypothetical protein